MNLPLLKSLSEAAGVPGREERVRKILERECKALFDEITVDPMGSLIATKKPKAKNGKPKRVLLACHIDEIGFYVKHVDDKGYVRVQSAGGFDTRNLFARRVMIQSSGGEDFAWYLEKVPGAMARLGVWDGIGTRQELHQPGFDLDERAMIHGVRTLVALTRLEDQSG